ncbi:Vacuolar transporter chaperone 4 [Seminavis robusta]|uniref:Vacuolar transporter chaperone 4 n=1 Tax=Seminavis robusta TaxID=568900 RepID=A0A9N8HA66_9STRA|nr:Vacuolar transporter chaperone 4 [Seminavis robusta]|eukprot:Sro231_g093540.1 Vacuolar transporter chaperone 4 (1149) ;mRNA; r:19628-23074
MSTRRRSLNPRRESNKRQSRTPTSSLSNAPVYPNHNLSAFAIHEAALYAEISNACKRITHGHVALEAATTASHNHTGDDFTAFIEQWEAEISRVGDLLQAQQQNLEFSAKALLTNVEASLHKLLTDSDEEESEMDELSTNMEEESCAAEGVILSWRVKTEELVDACLKLQRFANQNKELLEEIGTYADEKLGTSCLVSLKRRFSQAPWKTGPNSALIVVLSDIYDMIRTAEERQRSGATAAGSKWVAPTSFERATTKYWVREDQLTDLLLAAVAESPLLVYGKSGRLTSKADCLSQRSEGDKLWDQLATPITSIYFDSPSMALYQERLPRREGAQLLRARWYGRRPTGTEVIFLELKTHHEKWINTKSVKERVAIREKDMVKFLSMENWNLNNAEAIALSACPTLDSQGLAKAADRLLRMHDLVVLHGLRPCVRTCYLRAAFQSSSSNALRLTIDRNITMIDESKTLPGSWCLPEDAIIQNTMATRVPFVVLEVKVAGDNATPAIAQDLELRGVIQEATKFSKFLTGAAAFNMDKIGKLPHWADHPAFAAVFAASYGGANTSSLTRNKVDDTSDNTSKTSSDGSSSDKAEKSFNPTASTAGTGRTPSQNAASFAKSGASTRRRGTSSSSALIPNVISSASAAADEEDTTKVRRKGPFGIGGLFACGQNSHKKSRSVAPKRPARVEPKSYFANERTFIQWISASLLLVTISVILLGIDSEHGATSTYARKSGIAVCCGAVIIVFYATYVYFRRLSLLSKGSAYGYIDHVGPFVLAVSVCGGVTVLLVYFLDEIRAAQAVAAKEVYLHEEIGQCYLHSNRGISKLEYQPSDIVVDKKRNALLVPSVQRILLHSLYPPLPNRENRVKTLIEIPNSNLEGLTVIDDRVFALSEGPKRTELIELQWNGEDDELSVIHRWKLSNSEEAEALAFVPDKTRRSGRLFVDVNRQIHIYNVPDPAATTPPQDSDEDDDSLVLSEAEASEPKELERIGSLNNHVLKSGLTEMKISSMYYFEGIAYILHDNEMLLRAWDLDEGELLADIPLPRVEGGFSKEWEGVALERREIVESQGNSLLTERNQNLRGSSEEPTTRSQLILHLALDTPAQIWSLAVEEGPSRGSLILPSCAVSAHASADSISEDESSDSLEGSAGRNG